MPTKRVQVGQTTPSISDNPPVRGGPSDLAGCGSPYSDPNLARGTSPQAHYQIGVPSWNPLNII